MRILFVWTGVTSYMADCWRELQRRPGVELKIVVECVESGKEFDRGRVLQALDTCVVGDLPSDQPISRSSEQVNAWMNGWKPDVMFAVGWHSKVVRALVMKPEWADVPKVCCFDLPWRWKLRCIAAKFVLRPFLRHYAAAYVPGRACERYAKWLGFQRIHRGLFSIDQKRFGDGRRAGGRCGFMYVGRMAEEKRIDLIEAAFGRYRELGGNWSIDYYGGRNFKTPEELTQLYVEHACLVLASAFDPWPLVVLEAKASGCEVIMSDRCGNRFELDAHVTKFGDVEALAGKMLEVEKGCRREVEDEDLSMWTSEAWAERVMEIAEGLRG